MARQNIVVAIQAHPRRAELAEALLDRLDGRASIVWDPDPDGPASPWRTYRRCIETAPEDASHLCIIQEDVVLCKGFRTAVEAAVTIRPTQLLILCVTSQGGQHRVAVQRACQQGDSWAELPLGHWISAICNCWPIELAHSFVSWVDAQNFPSQFGSDDEIIGRWARANGIRPLASVPSLAQHPDLVPSVISRRRRNGSNRARQAAIFVDEDCTMAASEIDWSIGPGGSAGPS